MNEIIKEQKYIKKAPKSEVVSTPLVSVIVATYRRGDTLRRTLLSLANQTYSYIELVVVDDNADKDWNAKVEEIIDNIKSQFKNRIIYIKNKKNKGAAETRNIGINRASGDYVTFLDDDDIYLPNKVKNQVEHMINNNSDYSLTDIYLYDENEKLVEKRKRNYIKDVTKASLLRYHLMYHMTGTDTIMFRKKYLLSINGFSPINVGDEFYLMKKAIEGSGKFSYLPLCDVKAYVHKDTNGLSSGESKINGEKQLYKYKKGYFSNLSFSDIQYVRMRHYLVIAYAELRQSSYAMFMLNTFKSFVSSPLGFVKMALSILNQRKNER
jgi:glycosyltransferase involved in cell wall biosynthesis